MNISYNWLKEYLQFDLSPQETADALTSIGLETEGVEEIQTVKGGLEGLIIGEVLTCVPHPNSDHLHLTTVNIGNGEEPLRIVCGAPNVTAGQKVVVAVIGTKLYFGEEVITIKRSKIRGEESFGMICAEDEIGLGTSHNGIIVLPQEAVVGTPAKEYYHIKSDYLLEIDITPNRSDAISHFGVARDLAAWLKQAGKPYKLTKPSVEGFQIDRKEGGIDVTVEKSEACPRYSGLTLRGVTVRESPQWLKEKLLTIGLRPINNVVDVTNFVLHETGHPMHAFDAAHITGNRVTVRTLPDKTRFVTLDEVERELDANDLMICNAREGMCIAGVFGGLKSGVTETTTDLFLESAFFHPTWIRKTARRHGLSTDSSFRFERGVDPNNTVYVLKRAAMLIKELAGGEITGEIRDIYPIPVEPPRVELSLEKTDALIGKNIGINSIKSILESLEIEIEAETEGALTLRIPTYRTDVLRDVDVIEEILRIYGYNNVEISESLKANLSYRTPTDRKHQLQTLISEQLTANGFHEIMNNSLTKKAYYETGKPQQSENSAQQNNASASENGAQTEKTLAADHCVPLLNPLSNDLGVMRQTLLFGGLESIAYNRNRKQHDLRLYEFGNCYFFDASQKSDSQILASYSEETHIGLWICGKRSEKNWAIAKSEESSFFELKAYVENILMRLGLNRDQLLFEPITHGLFSNALTIRTHRNTIGIFGIISPKTRAQFDINSDVFFAEMNWDILMKETEKGTVHFTEIPKFPAVSRDLALLIDKGVTFDAIRKIAFKSEKKLLKQVTLFDVYEGKNLPENKKSYAVNFLLQDEEKTLQEKQIDAIMQKIRYNLEKELKAQLR